MRILILCLGLFPLSVLADEWEKAKKSPSASLSIEGKVRTEKVDDGKWTAGALALKSGGKVALKVKAGEGAKIRWYQIVPDVSGYYKNANHPWEENAYKWVGFGKISYKRVELKAFRGKREVGLFDSGESILQIGGPLGNARLGSFWIQAETLKDGVIRRSPGLDDTDHRGITPKVFRVTVRDNDDYVGHLTGFFNVPGIFGSVPYQSHNYIGVDCADVLVAAYGKWKGKKIKRDYNVSMLVSEWPKVASFKLAGGNPSEPIAWGDKVKPGDFIAVKYGGRSRYQHIGALYEDTNKDGKLDASDTVLHAGPEALHPTKLGRGGFDGEVAILRPK